MQRNNGKSKRLKYRSTQGFSCTLQIMSDYFLLNARRSMGLELGKMPYLPVCRVVDRT